MIYLRTGKPGSGKTLRTVQEAMKAVSEGREVYALNVRDLDYEFTGIKPFPFDHLDKWQELPTGSMLIVDEVQKYLQPCPPNTRQPDWIEALTRNRHYGIDLHLITQHPRLINYYVRELVNYHEHVVRIDGGAGAARVYGSEGLMSITPRGIVNDAEFRLWKYPTELYGVYKSADAHTVKRYVPQRLKVLVAGALLVVVGLGFAAWAMSGISGDEVASEPERVEPITVPAPERQPVPVPVERVTDHARSGYSNALEYAVLHTPLVDGMPWTAPAYAHRQVVAEPEIYCVIFHSQPAERCTCMSDQGTRLHVEPALCRTIALDGVYNPYRRATSARGAIDGQRTAAGLFD